MESKEPDFLISGVIRELASFIYNESNKDDAEINYDKIKIITEIVYDFIDNFKKHMSDESESKCENLYNKLMHELVYHSCKNNDPHIINIMRAFSFWRKGDSYYFINNVNYSIRISSGSIKLSFKSVCGDLIENNKEFFMKNYQFLIHNKDCEIMKNTINELEFINNSQKEKISNLENEIIKNTEKKLIQEKILTVINKEI